MTQTSAPFGGKQPSVLLIEDNPGDVLLIKRAFNQCDDRILLRVVRNGTEAEKELRALDANSVWLRPDLILLDISLPAINGLELLRIAKEGKNIRRIPLVILTNSSSDGDLKTALGLHANTYLCKPQTFDELQVMVRRLVDYWFNTAYLIENPSPSVA